jgi:hypothetical protein
MLIFSRRIEEILWNFTNKGKDLIHTNSLKRQRLTEGIKSIIQKDVQGARL